jgi:hypothetical protein
MVLCWELPLSCSGTYVFVQRWSFRFCYNEASRVCRYVQGLVMAPGIFVLLLVAELVCAGAMCCLDGAGLRTA